ncbi:hypothetical protein DH2020_024995 [Rehmannia glutinosa]|uniref:ZZ-type domain-containing protein n=1 Tax=Rehmannia glutinosa TaxID=99300 RepID=A0ABR0W2S3_REHGL
MGRSRSTAQAAAQAAADDPGQSRSKRKRSTQNVENTESVPPEVPGITDGKRHCTIVTIATKTFQERFGIKCVICSDFDLCVECFSVGAEVYPHKSNHPYRVMDNLAFPLICPDWNADEEMLLLEGTGMKSQNMLERKTRSQCIDHYDKIFMNSPCFPLPDMSHVMGKNREELLAMAKEHGETKKGSTTSEEVDGKEESSFSARIKMEDQRKEGQAGRSSSSISSGTEPLRGYPAKSRAMVVDAIKVEASVMSPEFQSDRSVGEKKPRTSGDEGVSMKVLSGYNSKRQEFEVECDNDASSCWLTWNSRTQILMLKRELKFTSFAYTQAVGF